MHRRPLPLQALGVLIALAASCAPDFCSRAARPTESESPREKAAASDSSAAGRRQRGIDALRFVSDALPNSPTFSRLAKTVPLVRCMVEEEESDAVIAALLEETETHTVRRATLRVGNDGSIGVLSIGNLEDHWEFEYRPHR